MVSRYRLASRVALSCGGFAARRGLFRQVFLRKAKIPIEHEVLAFGVANHPLPVASKLRVVRGEQDQPGQGSLAKVLDHVAIPEIRVDAPMGRDRTEIHDPHMASWGFLVNGFGHETVRLPGSLLRLAADASWHQPPL